MDYTTTMAYDSSGAPYGLSNNTSSTPNLATLVYNARAQLDTINLQTSTGSALAAEQFGYDANLRVTSMTTSWQSGSGNTGTIFAENSSYDNASNVISLSTTQAAVPGFSGSGGSETQNFCYDEQNRLLWAGNSGTQPAAGNGTCGSGTLSSGLTGGSYSNSYVSTHLGQLWQGPLSGGSTQYQYLYCSSSRPHQLSGLYPLGSTCSNQSGAVYSSSNDALGNVTSRTSKGTTATLSYDTQDHFTEWNAGATSQEWYMYDGAGQRVLRRSTDGSTTSLTVYAFGREEHVYTSAGTNQGNTYYYTLGGHLVGKSDGGSITFYQTDLLGSVVADWSNTAGSAAIKGNEVYGPYGKQRYNQGTHGTPKGFTGQYNDSLTGLDYYNARYYDPVVGVFLSADTVQGNGSGMNPYGYVGGNPETKNDPTGKYFAPPGGNGGLPPSCVQLGDCVKVGGGSGGTSNSNGGVTTGCTVTNCSVTLGRHTYNLDELKNVTNRGAFLQAFYAKFAMAYETAELQFFNFLLTSHRLLYSTYWNSVDYLLIRDQLLAAYDFLHGLAAQSEQVASWITFLAHPSNNEWWAAHNGSINTGDRQARTSGLYAKESWVEQHFINETVNVLNGVQFVSDADPTTLASNLFSPQNGTTGTLTKVFYPQQYNDASDITSFVVQGAAVELGGTVTGIVGMVVAPITFVSALL